MDEMHVEVLDAASTLQGLMLSSIACLQEMYANLFLLEAMHGHLQGCHG